MKPDAKPKKTHHEKQVEGLLTFQVFQAARIYHELVKLNEGVSKLANEVVTKVNAKFDAIEQTLRDEAEEIKAAIEAAGAGGATPEEVAALEARADGINAAIEALVAATPEPPVE